MPKQLLAPIAAKAITADDLKAKLEHKPTMVSWLELEQRRAVTALAVGTNGNSHGATAADPAFRYALPSSTVYNVHYGANTLSLQVAGDYNR